MLNFNLKGGKKKEGKKKHSATYEKRSATYEKNHNAAYEKTQCSI
jgi:hypothetical protein